MNSVAPICTSNLAVSIMVKYAVLNLNFNASKAFLYTYTLTAKWSCFLKQCAKSHKLVKVA